MKVPKCLRVECEDGRIWGTDWCLRHTGDTEADAEVNARLAELIGGRTAELHGVTSRDGNVRRMNPGERPVPGDLLPDGRVRADGTLEPYPEDEARARDVIADLDPAHPDTPTFHRIFFRAFRGLFT